MATVPRADHPGPPPGESRRKLVLCAEFQGEGAVRGTTTGFQRTVDELVRQAGRDPETEVAVYCSGREDRIWRHAEHPNVVYRQYRPFLSVRDAIPGIPDETFPFLVDMMPLRLGMVRDMVAERPEVIHTFQTFGATDLAGFAAARWLRFRGRPVRLVSTITTEIDTYFADYAEQIFDHFCRQLEATSVRQVVSRARASARDPEDAGRPLLRALAASLWVALSKLYGLRSRNGFPAFCARAYRRSLKWEIPAYLARCDGVTLSRPEDRSRYRVERGTWELPHACDTRRFRVFDESAESFLVTVEKLRAEGALSPSSAETLVRVATHPGIARKRPILYVGRLSEEKRFSLILDGYAELMADSALQRRVHLICVGTGMGGRAARDRFGDRVTLPGLLPNELLPHLHNLVRARGGFFASASDSETYGIALEEATACGLPIVAMEKGTRGHLFVPGDRIGEQPVATDPSLMAELASAGAGIAERALRPGLNGIAVLDRTEGRGLSALGPEDPRHRWTQRAFSRALRIMAQLSEESLERMTKHAERFAREAKVDWVTIWRMLRHVYADDRRGHEALIRRRRHVPVEASTGDAPEPRLHT